MTDILEQEWGGKFLDVGGAGWLNLGHPKFAPASGDDYTAGILDAIDEAISENYTLLLPNRGFRFTLPLEIEYALPILGLGKYSALIADLGDTGVDAVTVNTGGAGTYVWDLRWERFAIVAPATSCRNLVVFNKCANMVLDLYARGGAAQWGVVVNGCLVARKSRIVVSENFAYPYIANTTATMPQSGLLKLTTATDFAANDMPCNAADLDILLEGGPGHGLRIENQYGQGNIKVRGVIQGPNGRLLYAENCLGLNLQSLHVEGNDSSSASELVDCKVPTVGPNVVFAGAGVNGELKLTGTLGAVLDGVKAEKITNGPTSRRTYLRQTFATEVVDLAGDMVVSGGPLSGGLDVTNVANLPAGGDADPHLLFEGGTFDYWPAGDAATPLGWSYLGTPPAWAKVDGPALGFFSRYAGEVTVGATLEGPAIVIPVAPCLGRWVTVSTWVYVETGEPDVQVHLWLNAGAAVRSGSSTEVKDGKVRLMDTFYVPFEVSAGVATTDLLYVIRTIPDPTPSDYLAGTLTLGDISLHVGSTGPAAFIQPPHVRENLYLNGQRITYAAAMPTSGFYRDGDFVFKTPRALGDPLGWSRLITGSAHMLGTDWEAI